MGDKITSWAIADRQQDKLFLPSSPSPPWLDPPLRLLRRHPPCLLVHLLATGLVGQVHLKHIIGTTLPTTSGPRVLSLWLELYFLLNWTRIQFSCRDNSSCRHNALGPGCASGNFLVHLILFASFVVFYFSKFWFFFKFVNQVAPHASYKFNHQQGLSFANVAT